MKGPVAVLSIAGVLVTVAASPLVVHRDVGGDGADVTRLLGGPFAKTENCLDQNGMMLMEQSGH